MKRYFKMKNNIERIVIVGGGSAGWMTAAMLSKQLHRSTRITLIESDQISTIGVGEATIPPIRKFNQLLEINEVDFLKACNGSIKLGIEFENWTRLNHKYMHPFGGFGIDFDYTAFVYYWLKAKLNGDARELQCFSLAWQMSAQNKFHPPDKEMGPLADKLDYAYHFDASLYAKYLRKYAESLGVVRQEGKVTQVQKNQQSGFIETLTLEDGSLISGDLFIDCSGQRSLLLGDALQVQFENWSDQLVNDRAIAVQTSHINPVSPYTRSIAHQAGWQWRIPLQTRMGNGNVYSSQFMDDEQALNLLLSDVEADVISEPNFIRFKTGRRDRFWDKNCVAIGLSAGFLEPLESTSLHLIQSAILRLVQLFPAIDCNELLQQEYNKATAREYEDIRDFIMLHYKATERDDSDYWNYCRTMTVTDTLKNRLSLYEPHGHMVFRDEELFHLHSWMAVLAGQNQLPQQFAPILKGNQDSGLLKTLDAMENDLKAIAATCPDHELYISKVCPHRP